VESTQKNPEQIVEGETPLVEHASVAFGSVLECARSLAAMHNLVCDDGTVVCWACKRVEATYPALHCADCLAVALRPSNEYLTVLKRGHPYLHRREPDEVSRWKGMKRNMLSDDRMDREKGVKLLAGARALPGHSDGDYQELYEIFVRRFGESDGTADESPRARTTWRDR
jgi:hypothetical protein